MTETEWLTSTDPDAMLRFLEGGFTDRLLGLLRLRTSRLSGRKLRLFYSACARAHPDIAADNRRLKALDAADEYADGQVEDEVLIASWQAVVELWGMPPDWPTFLLWRAFDRAIRVEGLLYRALDTWGAYLSCIAEAEHSVTFEPDAREQTLREWQPIAAGIVREIFANPFREATLDPAWSTSNDGAVPTLAASIYRTRSFSDMPILADALEEAGCQDDTILRHCREAQSHVRGCWMLDALLDRR